MLRPASMPTPAERLATLEAIAVDNRRRIDDIFSSINGGTGFEWEQSVRGRLHHMANQLAAADKLAEAAREVRRMQAETQRSRIKTWQWSVIAAAAVVGAASPYVVLLVH